MTCTFTPAQTPNKYRILTSAVDAPLMLAVMNSSITRTPVACSATRLVRYVGGVELPVAGTWHIPAGHADIVFWQPRRLRHTARWRGRAKAATIVVGDAPDDVRVAVVFDTGMATPTGMSEGTTGVRCLVADADSSAKPWAVSGEVYTDGAGVPLRATLGYHGVWRRGDRAYGWFTLAGAVGPHPAGGRTVRFCFDLLADGPDGECGPA